MLVESDGFHDALNTSGSPRLSVRERRRDCVVIADDQGHHAREVEILRRDAATSSSVTASMRGTNSSK